ncbi:hypothetical protein FOZ63_007635 [Perkinsus olseni]|uniref:Uncharacterized protein n=1 Tax=Perkinsus olseni TaxID=32597 RepID=A0A7J6UK27_PEROL|nr:hypothetical protein FOZ62_024930 [Perkinsus olseni]KAF4757649.1 hypothetical protein FOZ63_007635 [Perkinsus olseni]
MAKGITDWVMVVKGRSRRVWMVTTGLDGPTQSNLATIVTRMARERFIIISILAPTTALALPFLFNKPKDDFPPLLGVYPQPEANGSITTCHCSNRTSEPFSTQFVFYFKQGSDVPRTGYISCPQDGDHPAFLTVFYGKVHAIRGYYVAKLNDDDNFPTMKFYQFNAPPPLGAGMDPLREIYQRGALQQQQQARLSSHGWRRLFRTILRRFSRRNECTDVMEIVKKQFDTFSALCDAYRNISNSAVEAARNETWNFWDKGEEHIEIFPPLGNRTDGMSEQDKFIALAHPIYHQRVR